MKNIHVLPTDKEPIKGDLLLRHIFKNNSKLECKSWWRYKNTITFDGVTQYTTLNGSFRDITSSFKTQNIYITSDEEIKEGDWYLFFMEEIPDILQCQDSSEADRCNGRIFSIGEASKKIILTTDQDLIKDGVQAIDDDFLKWFVKNPSCEDVKVEKTAPIRPFGSLYKIIIQKKENDYTALLKPVGTRQTAVEWLYENLKSHFKNDGDLLEVVQFSFEQAKEMEKQQQSYSKEEVIDILMSMPVDSHANIIEWFEQFKNK